MSQPSLPGIEPPHDLEAERNCLGAMCYRRANVPLVIDTGLEPGHFLDPNHAREYGHIFECWIADEDPVPGLAGSRLATYVLEAPQVSRPDLYAQAVLDAAERRLAFIVAAGLTPPVHIGWVEYWEAKR